MLDMGRVKCVRSVSVGLVLERHRCADVWCRGCVIAAADRVYRSDALGCMLALRDGDILDCVRCGVALCGDSYDWRCGLDTTTEGEPRV
jgi:hypothetical protein